MDSHMNNIAELIYETYEKNKELPRQHLGCSMLGDPCDRKLFISFRHAVAESHPGRILKLFRFGHEYEDTAIRELREIGCKIINRQTNVDFGSFISGSTDGIIDGGLPGYEKERLLLEIKTHGDRSFKELVSKGVVLSKPVHHIQMVCYMYGLKLNRALYYAVNKNTSEIYTEIVEADDKLAEKYINRGKKIALSDYMPEPLSADPSWYQCRMCNYHDFCHNTKLTKEIHCRTCALSTANADSTFTCSKYDNHKIEFEYQVQGCESHVLHPCLVPWERTESTKDFEAVYIIDGQHVRNGEPDERVFSSKEIIADSSACARPDDVIDELREVFGAKII